MEVKNRSPGQVWLPLKALSVLPHGVVGRKAAKQLPKKISRTIQKTTLTAAAPMAPKNPILKAVPADTVTSTIGRCIVGTGGYE